MRRCFHLICVTVLLGAALTLFACGKKGPLYLPDEAKPARNAASQ